MVDVGNKTEVAVSNLQEGNTYYFAATAYDTAGNESTYSNEVSYAISAAPSCSYTISPSTQSFEASGGQGSVSVTTQTDCSWTASSGVSWVTLSSAGSGTGSGTVSYTVAANSGSDDRSAGLTIAGNILTITQAAGSQSASYKFTPVTRYGWWTFYTGSYTGKATTQTDSQSVSYKISAIARFGGSISPAGSVTVASGGSKTFTITSNSGYRIKSVRVDGRSVGTPSSYTFTNVTANHVIAAVFSKK
jgi:hypothetical protein